MLNLPTLGNWTGVEIPPIRDQARPLNPQQRRRTEHIPSLYPTCPQSEPASRSITNNPKTKVHPRLLQHIHPPIFYPFNNRSVAQLPPHNDRKYKAFGAHKMSNDAFHYFSKLPLELRCMIWMHCLPHRIAEEDTPDSFFDGYQSKHVCWNRRMTLQNAQLPAIAYINSESRQVALGQGRLLEPADVRTMESLWVQPHRDLLHLNWTRLTYASWGVDSDAPGWVDEFLLQAKDLGMRPSVAADLIHVFSLKAVLDCAGDADALGTHNPFHFGISDIAKILYHCRGEGADDVREMVDILPWAKGQRSRLDIAMAGVSLHITREVALRSGLFGLLGDAPVQMVDVDDEARLREFQALYREHALEKEPVVQTLFETFTSSLFKTAVEIWKRKAEWTILAYMWQSARDRNLDILGTNPGSAWLPQLSEQEYIYMDQYLPNEQHPWVKHARQTAPKLRLRIMVRYCTNQCYIKERLPKGFAFE